MINQKKHLTMLVKILKEIYHESDLRINLGFKGGTALYLFYNLPRLSVDLDFNLINLNKKLLVFEKLKKLLTSFGELEEAIEKKSTLFFLLNYEKTQRKIKIEVSKRGWQPKYEVKNYLGIPILVVNKPGLASDKLAAFLTRKHFASRDLYDLWFILKNDFPFDKEYLKQQVGDSFLIALKKAKKKLKMIKTNQLLQGIGELVEKKEKFWIKKRLISEVSFYLDLCLEKMEE